MHHHQQNGIVSLVVGSFLFNCRSLGIPGSISLTDLSNLNEPVELYIIKKKLCHCNISWPCCDKHSGYHISQPLCLKNTKEMRLEMSVSFFVFGKWISKRTYTHCMFTVQSNPFWWNHFCDIMKKRDKVNEQTKSQNGIRVKMGGYEQIFNLMKCSNVFYGTHWTCIR